MSQRKHAPRLVFSELGQRWYIVTRFRERDGINTETGEKTRYMVALEKYDITDQMKTILREVSRERTRKLARRPA